MTGEELGPLHGVPFSVKDLLWTRRVLTTGGSRLFADHVPEEDAVVVERLKGAGGVILGKTNTPEFGHKGVTDSPLFGITRNPWNLALTPGGSSGGAGAAVAAGLGPLAVGTDGGGSIRIPASFCGIYGLKPSFGRVPQFPSFRGWETFSHTGPMTRTVRDAALMLDAIAGPDDRDRYSIPADGGAVVPRVLRRGHRRSERRLVGRSGARHRRPRGPRSLRPGGGALRVARLPRGSGDADLGQPRGGVSRPGGGRDACRLGRPPRRRRRASRPEPRRAPALRARDHDRAVHARIPRAPRPLDRRAALPRALRSPHHADGRGAAVRGRTARRQGDRGPRGRPARLDRRSPIRSTSPGSRRRRSPSASPRRGCPWGFRSSAGAMATGRCSPPPRPSRPPLRGRIRSRASTERLAGSTGGCTELATPYRRSERR